MYTKKYCNNFFDALAPNVHERTKSPLLTIRVLARKDKMKSEEYRCSPRFYL